MRTIQLSLMMVSACLLLSLAGCQKGGENGTTDEKTVKFGVTSGMPGTRTVYSGDGEKQGDKLVWERIDWLSTDKLLIWSDNAINRDGRSGQSAVYELLNIQPDGRESKASINRAGEDGLVFLEEPSSYQFWGMYPSDAYKNESVPQDGNVEFEIPAGQTGTDTQNNGVLAPDMNKAVMFAYTSIPSEQHVDLLFKPAFTAFEFHLVFEAYKGNAAPIELQKVELSSEKSNLAGSVSAAIGATSTYGIKEGTTPSKVITYTFPAGTKLSQDKPLTFTVFTLPNKVEDLRVTFYYTDPSSSVPDIRSGVLSYKEKALSFDACLKHKLTGIFVRENYEADGLTFYFEPMWEQVPLPDTSNGNNAQSSQFVVGPDGVVQNAWDDRLKNPTETAAREQGLTGDDFDDFVDPIKNASRQVWEFLTGGTATVNYSIMLPKTGTWRVEVCGDTEAFTVSPTSGTLAGADDASTKIELSVKPVENKAGTIWLKTFVTPTGGNEYSIDSETQLYDLRGYHKFVVNTSHEYTSDYTE